MAPHSSTLGWKIPWTEEPGRLQSVGSPSQTWLSNFTFTFHFHTLEKETATQSSVLAWRIPGTEEPGGLPSTGSHRVRHDWNDLAAAASVAHLWDDQQGWAYDWEQFSVLKLMDTCGSWTNFNIFLGSFLFPGHGFERLPLRLQSVILFIVLLSFM